MRGVAEGRKKALTAGSDSTCLPCGDEGTAMPRLKVHYDGWVALPEAFRRKLGLERGNEVEAELVDGTIVLRPSKGSAKAIEEGVSAEAALATPAPSVLAAEAQE